MGKSLVTTLLKRHVNIYSDLYTLCFLHSYVQSPQCGAGPQGHDTAPGLRLPIFWYQVFGQQSKLVLELISPWHPLSGAEAAFSRGSPPPELRLMGYTKQTQPPQESSVSSRWHACSPPAPQPPRCYAKVAGRGLGPTCKRDQVAGSKARPICSSLSQAGCEEEEEEGGGRGQLRGVKASGRQLAPASRKGAKGKAVSPAGRGWGGGLQWLTESGQGGRGS